MQIMKKQSSANLGFEEKLWAVADKMRNNMDPSEYKHIVLGLIFLKYISDSFEDCINTIKNDSEFQEWELHDTDSFTARNVFWVPQEARWEYLQNNATDSNFGRIIDDAMTAIEKENSVLKGVLPKDYGKYSV